MFKIRPKLHLVSYYQLLPTFALAIALLIFSYFGISESMFYATYFYVVVSAVMIAAMSLFEPWFSEIEVTDDMISQSTFFGGEIKINIKNLDYDDTVWSKSGLLIMDLNGNRIHVSSLLFAKSDISKVYDHLSEIS